FADQRDTPPARDFKADIFERRCAPAGISKAHLLDANAVAERQALALHWAGGFLLNRQAQEREDLSEERLVSGRERPAEIDLLQERQQSLRAEGERTEHWKRKREPAFARGYHNCQHRDEDHAKSLDHEARRGADEGGARF